jgi:hypothetical protein
MRKEWKGGKGDRPRPIDKDKYRKNLDKIDWSKKGDKKEKDDKKQR